MKRQSGNDHVSSPLNRQFPLCPSSPSWHRQNPRTMSMWCRLHPSSLLRQNNSTHLWMLTRNFLQCNHLPPSRPTRDHHILSSPLLRLRLLPPSLMSHQLPSLAPLGHPHPNRLFLECAAPATPRPSQPSRRAAQPFLPGPLPGHCLGPSPLRTAYLPLAARLHILRERAPHLPSPFLQDHFRLLSPSPHVLVLAAPGQERMTHSSFANPRPCRPQARVRLCPRRL
jgi:hypothetical protein